MPDRQVHRKAARITVAQLFHVIALFAQSFAQSHPNKPKHHKEGQLEHF